MLRRRDQILKWSERRSLWDPFERDARRRAYILGITFEKKLDSYAHDHKQQLSSYALDYKEPLNSYLNSHQEFSNFYVRSFFGVSLPLHVIFSNTIKMVGVAALLIGN
jgi:hypothetical protein